MVKTLELRCTVHQPSCWQYNELFSHRHIQDQLSSLTTVERVEYGVYGI